MVITEEHLMMQYISLALELDIFQKKLKSSQETKISLQIFIENKHTFRVCAVTFVLDLLILC